MTLSLGLVGATFVHFESAQSSAYPGSTAPASRWRESTRWFANSEISVGVISFPFGLGLLGIPSLVTPVTEKQLFIASVKITFPHKGVSRN